MDFNVGDILISHMSDTTWLVTGKTENIYGGHLLYGFCNDETEERNIGFTESIAKVVSNGEWSHYPVKG